MKNFITFVITVACFFGTAHAAQVGQVECNTVAEFMHSKVVNKIRKRTSMKLYKSNDDRTFAATVYGLSSQPVVFRGVDMETGNGSTTLVYKDSNTGTAIFTIVSDRNGVYTNTIMNDGTTYEILTSDCKFRTI